MTNAALLKGVIVPATTPFTATEEIDEKAFTAQLEWLVAQGVLGIVVGGSTGEGYALTDDEFVRLVDLAIEVAGPTLPVLAGIIADSTQAAVRRSRLVVGRRLAALQVAPPHYIFAPSEEGMIGFYRSLAEATPFPLLIYNVIPWATVSPRQAGEIMRAVPGVVAIKQSGTDFSTYADLVRTVGAHRVFAAIDAALISCYELGASGSIAAIAIDVIKKNKLDNLEVKTQVPLYTLYWSMAVRKDAFQLHQWLNNFIYYQEVSGALSTLHQKWIGIPTPGGKLPTF
jgi:dihydrodipicolinate synthase/N-acetylneuraminate lyase